MELVSIADVSDSAIYGSLIINALREGQTVTYHKPQVFIATPKASKPAPAPAGVKKVIRSKQQRNSKQQRLNKPVITKPASSTTQIINSNEVAIGLNEPVFIAWSHLTEAEREAFTDLRESLGVVMEIRRKQGVRRSVLVQWDNGKESQWMHPDELATKCEYCIETRQPEAQAEAERMTHGLVEAVNIEP